MKKKDRALMPGAVELGNTLNQLGPPSFGGQTLGMQGMHSIQQQASLAAQAGMQGMSAEHEACIRAKYPHHNHCPKCSRMFINNISCPRCGWRLKK